MASSSMPKTKGLKLIGKKWFITTDTKICGYFQLGPFDDAKEAQWLRDCIFHELGITHAAPIYQNDDLLKTLAYAFCKRFKTPELIEMIKEKKLYSAYKSYVMKGKNVATTPPPTDKECVVLTDEDEKEKENRVPVNKKSFLKEKESFLKEKEAGAGKTQEDLVLLKGLAKKLQQQLEVAEHAVLTTKTWGTQYLLFLLMMLMKQRNRVASLHFLQVKAGL